jgi:hypothetical protein
MVTDRSTLQQPTEQTSFYIISMATEWYRQHGCRMKADRHVSDQDIKTLVDTAQITGEKAVMHGYETWSLTVREDHTVGVRSKTSTALTILMTLFWVTSCGLVGRNQRHGGTPSSALKMDTECSAETLASTKQSTWRLNPKERHQRSAMCLGGCRTLHTN